MLGWKNFDRNHSKRGAKTTSVLFSIVESCKLNKINPQKYLKDVVQELHAKNKPRTPAQYSQAIPANVN
jgi:transposase